MIHISVLIHLSDLLIAKDMLHRFENGAQNPEGNERASSNINNSRPILCSVSYTGRLLYYFKIGLKVTTLLSEASYTLTMTMTMAMRTLSYDLGKGPRSCSQFFIGGGRPSPQLWNLQCKL